MVPIGNNLSSLLLVTFSKYSSWLIYILFYFFKLIKKKKVNMDLESRKCQ